MEVLIVEGFDRATLEDINPIVHIVEKNSKTITLSGGDKATPTIEHLKNKYKSYNSTCYSFRILKPSEIKNEPVSTFNSLSMGDFKKIFQYL